MALALPVAAQTSREAEQVRRLRLQLQQLQQELGARQQAVADLQRRLDAAAAESKDRQGRIAAQSRAAEQARRELAAAAGREQALEARAAEQQAALESERRSGAALRAELAQAQRLRATLQDSYAALEARHRMQAEGLQACIARNGELQALGRELLQRYERKGFGEVLAADEPFLQWGRVSLENLVQGYREKLDAQAVAAPPR